MNGNDVTENDGTNPYDLTRAATTIMLDGSQQGVALLHGNGEVTLLLDAEVSRYGMPVSGIPYLDSVLGRTLTVARLRVIADMIEDGSVRG